LGHFSGFGIMYHEKSGNPGLIENIFPPFKATASTAAFASRGGRAAMDEAPTFAAAAAKASKASVARSTPGLAKTDAQNTRGFNYVDTFCGYLTRSQSNDF
jgi:hypothetical protein